MPIIWINQACGQWPIQGKARKVTETVDKEEPAVIALMDKDISQKQNISTKLLFEH